MTVTFIEVVKVMTTLHHKNIRYTIGKQNY